MQKKIQLTKEELESFINYPQSFENFFQRIFIVDVIREHDECENNEGVLVIFDNDDYRYEIEFTYNNIGDYVFKNIFDFIEIVDVSVLIDKNS
jgi:hypothetical protein